MRILIASSEVEPFAKTGGLADVCGALPGELAKLGHQVIVFLPAYRCVSHAGVRLEPANIEFSVPVGSRWMTARLLTAYLPGTNVPIYFVDQPEYFDREQLYSENNADYEDNAARFIFFCRAVLEATRHLDWEPDLIHCNDWQTGLIPALLKLEYAPAGRLQNAASLITIHNMAYQGRFWHWDMLLTGLDWQYFNWRQMEFYGQLNLLKTGIVFADMINTVSPTYALEIQNSDQGCGLEGALHSRRSELHGILNGIDTRQWNPETDRHLAERYNVNSWQAGKAACKRALQQSCHLEQAPHKPLIGIVGRLASQKGWSLILPTMRQWLSTIDVQWVVLGTGQSEYENALRQLNRTFPGRVSANLQFSDALAHQIEAGADIFLMPSQYEPCGLNQMYSMAYGTVPVVRRTGGLADTVIDASAENMSAGRATGFTFEGFAQHQMEHALARAVHLHQKYPQEWQALVTRGMNQDWSWQASARRYIELYERAAVLQVSHRQHQAH